MTNTEIVSTLRDLAREAGAEYPEFADTDDGILITDTASGQTWKVALRAFADPEPPIYSPEDDLYEDWQAQEDERAHQAAHGPGQ